ISSSAARHRPIGDEPAPFVTDTEKEGTKGVSTRLQGLLEITNTARHGQLFAAGKKDDVLAFPHWLEFLHTFQIHNHGTADALEDFGTELVLQSLHGFANNVSLFTDM